MRKSEEIYARAVWRDEDGHQYRICSMRDAVIKSSRILQYLNSNYKWQTLPPNHVLTLVGKGDGGKERERCSFSAALLINRYNKFAVNFHNQATSRKYENEAVDEIADRLAKEYFAKVPEQPSLDYVADQIVDQQHIGQPLNETTS